MKIVKITCDRCEKEIFESNKSIFLGASGGTLEYENTIKPTHTGNGYKFSMAHHEDMHFCSSRCFVREFLGDKYKEILNED